MPKTKRTKKKHVDTPRTKELCRNFHSIELRTPRAALGPIDTNLLSRASSIGYSENSLSPLPESPEADRRQCLNVSFRSPTLGVKTDLFDTSDLGCPSFNLSSVSTDNDTLNDPLYDHEVADSFSSFSPDPHFCPIKVELDSLQCEKVTSAKPSRKRSRHSPELHELLEKRPRGVDEGIKRTRNQSLIPQPNFQSPAKSRERCYSSLSVTKNSNMLQRCNSVIDAALVENLVENDWPLREITAAELAQLVLADHKKINDIDYDRVVVVDARYEYEFKGGHIKDAVSVPKIDEAVWQEKLMKLFFTNLEKLAAERVAVIFHCEFSINRGPNMRDWFRKHDREINRYPDLYYKDLYLLVGGYKGFYDAITTSDAFEPLRAYTPEMAKQHEETNRDIQNAKRRAKNRAKISRRAEPYMTRLRQAREKRENDSTPIATRRRRSNT